MKLSLTLARRKGHSLTVIIIFLCLYGKAQSQSIENTVLEFTGESIAVSGSGGNITVTGQLFYSKTKGIILTESNSSFKTDKSIIPIRPLIRIFKTSESYPQNLSLSITLQTVEIIDGKEKRTLLNTQFDIKNKPIKKVIKEIGVEEKYVLYDDGLSSAMLILIFSDNGILATYSDELSKLPMENYKMKGIKLTIQDGERVN